MRSTEAVRHIQHIASLGLDQRQAIPAMMQALAHVVPANQNPFFWADRDGTLVDFYGEDVDPLSMESTLPLTRHNTPDHVPTMDRMLGGPLLVNNTGMMRQMAGWHQSSFYNDMLRGNAAENSVDFQLRDASGIRGAFAISRGLKERPLQAQEMRRVAQLVPHFLHAMNAPSGPVPLDGTKPGEATYVIAGLAGEIISCSPGSLTRILQLADVPLGNGVRVSEFLQRLPAPAMMVLNRLQLINAGHNAPPATLDVPTRWGVLRVSAMILRTSTGGQTDTAIITLNPLIDRRIARAKRLVGTDLSPAERRVALRMAGSGDGEAIARDLGISVGAYRQYAKRIYMALGVDGRMGLKAMLDK